MAFNAIKQTLNAACRYFNRKALKDWDMVSNGTVTYRNIHRSVNRCSLSFLEAVQALFLQRARHGTAQIIKETS